MHTQGFPSIPFILLLPATLLHAATAPLGGCLLFIIMVRTATGASVTVLTAKIKSALNASTVLLINLNTSVLQAGSVTKTRLGFGLGVMMYSYLNVCVCKWGRW